MNMENMDHLPPAVDSIVVPAEPLPPPVEVTPEKTGFLKPSIACLAAAALPGLGHAILRKWDRALVFMSCIGIMFWFGVYLKGSLFNPDFGDLFSILKFAADAGSGSLYWLCWFRGIGVGDTAAYTYAFGNLFIYSAGLLNMLVIIDAFDVALGRKP